MIRHGDPEAEPARQVRVGRIAVLAVFVLGALWAPVIGQFRSLWIYLQAVQAYLMMPMAGVFFLGVLWRRTNATVTICHSQTQNLPDITRQADILIVAIGRAQFGKPIIKFPRIADKRKIRRDRCDVFSTIAEGIKGKRAVEWNLVDAIAPLSRRTASGVPLAMTRPFTSTLTRSARRNTASRRPAARASCAGASGWTSASERPRHRAILRATPSRRRLER